MFNVFSSRGQCFIFKIYSWPWDRMNFFSDILSWFEILRKVRENMDVRCKEEKHRAFQFSISSETFQKIEVCTFSASSDWSSSFHEMFFCSFHFSEAQPL